ncbi:MAG: manganese efflux pump MntP family protein [Deltaproteobacteria bacterium]|jgi:putative Mn2+ efflux pump MntP|nr:manganese efflux pump MntP family protein [Deltaproteobacteria bacterium]
MSLPELLAIAVALSLDAFAVATGIGCAVRRPHPGQYARVAGAFGLFQFFMPVAGWHLGASVLHYIAAWEHWIAFALLVWVGGSMLRSSWSPAMLKPQHAPAAGKKDPTSGSKLIILAVATSIDALAVGLSLSMLEINIWGPAGLIGCICAVVSALGLLLGASLARMPKLGSRAECVGGLTLIAIGFNILRQHDVF